MGYISSRDWMAPSEGPVLADVWLRCQKKLMANIKIEELDAQQQTLSKKILALSAETMSPEQIERLSVYLNRWEEIDFDDRRQVADGLISQIRATGECVAIEWKI